MTELDQVARLAQVRAGRPGGEAPAGPDCLDDDTIAAMADGALSSADRTAGLAHAARCARCRRAVASVARALADPAVAREVRRVRDGRRSVQRRFGRMALIAAAASAVALLAWPRAADEPASTHRAAPITAAPAPDAVWPVGPVAAVPALRWTRVAGADRYRVTLFTADGAVRYEAELTDTMVALPDSVLPVPGETYWWKVDARLGFDRWAASGLIEFSVAGASRR